MIRVEFRRVARGRVWHLGLGHQPTSALCAERTGDRGTETCPDRPPWGAKVCPRCLTVCQMLGRIGEEWRPPAYADEQCLCIGVAGVRVPPSIKPCPVHGDQSTGQESDQ